MVVVQTGPVLLRWIPISGIPSFQWLRIWYGKVESEEQQLDVWSQLL